MDDIVLTSTLRTQGYDARDVCRLRQRGDLVQLRRGAYARGQASERTKDEAHRDLIRATVPQLREEPWSATPQQRFCMVFQCVKGD